MQNFLAALQHAIATENWYAAITIALTLPDICGSIDTPGKNNSAQHYTKWFKKYVEKKYIKNLNGKQCVFMTGGDCYALRCAILHQGIADLTDQRARKVVDRFILHYSKVISIHCCNQNGKLVIDISIFCKDIADGVSAWEKDVSGDIGNRRKDALKNLLTLHLPDIYTGNITVAKIDDLFK